MKRVVLVLTVALLLLPVAAMADTFVFSGLGGNWLASPTAGNTFTAQSSSTLGVDFSTTSLGLVSHDTGGYIGFTTGTAAASCVGPSNCTFGAGGSVWEQDG